jgi:hypothetical protein
MITDQYTSQLGKLLVRTTHGAAHTVTGYNLAPPQLPLQLVEPHAIRVAAETEHVNPQPKPVLIHQPWKHA